ncbi:ThuA domain-containing protein [Erythrobacter sp. JK5]|uniref:ThuA domain-containing protein n=1 Tax=Erythrobacter sp. JK5 TaxID=2829500 RepID=UPI001BA905AB|nr:ThuA domain-containing protein [Erythrobacter sp. JK5]QUL37404.1 ThuA domain-containing protein [Erythrobacter sp. JK5]
MRSLLVLSGGHSYEEEPFDELIHSLGDWDVAHLVHPDAEQAVTNGAADSADALLFYDMAGYTFADGTVASRPPSEEYKAALTRRFAAGKGAVAMHHALAGWADWPEWHQWLGGQFHYQPGSHGPDSGYRHDVTYTAKVLTDHPVTESVPETFPATDELYLCPIDEASVTPLIRAEGFAFASDNFHSAANAVAGAMFSREGWDHPPGSSLVGWEAKALAAPLVYLQFGDGPETYANPHVRQIIANALSYTAGEQK